MFIFLLLIVLVLYILGLMIYTISKLKDDKYTDDVTLLKKVFNITVILTFVVYLIVSIISAISILYSELLFVLFLKVIFSGMLYVVVFKNGRCLIDNLSKKNIFIPDNVNYIQKIGYAFVYIAIVEIIAGLVLQAIYFFAQVETSYTLSLNIELLLFIVIGLLLIIVSKILKEAIVIYEENQLTI